MHKIRKILILVILIMMSGFVPVNASTNTPDYKQPIVELRGVWVATVSNLDIGRQITIDQYKQQYLTVLDNLERFNINAVFFQVRPLNDAFYQSSINPWSEFLFGAQGRDPGWDPLPWLIEETHKRGMEFHAWLNPYRASLDVYSARYDDLTPQQREVQKAAALNKMHPMNFARQNPDLLVQGDQRVLLNPAEPKVRQHVYDTISEIIENYDVDAIHFDDYFYNGVSMNQDRDQFLELTGSFSYDLQNHRDWRREQVDILIEGIHDVITDFNQTNQKRVQFGISPAAGWAPALSQCGPTRGVEGGMPDFPCWGYSSYHDLYADSRKWVKEEWIDYIVPQNYFELHRQLVGNKRTHHAVSEWWAEQVRGTSVKLYMGLGVHVYAIHPDVMPFEELVNQIAFNSQLDTMSGYVWFSYRNLATPSNLKMIHGVANLREAWYREALLPMTLTGDSTEASLQNLLVTRRNLHVDISFETDNNAIGYAIYRFEEQNPNFDVDNIKKILANNSEILTYTDIVENDDEFHYYIKAVLGDGTLSEQYNYLDVSEEFINTPPQILDFNVQRHNVVAAGDKFLITGNVYDDDDDQLEVFIEISTDGGNRYRNPITVPLVNNSFEYLLDIPHIITDNAVLRLTVSDGSESVQQLSHSFMIVESDTGYLSRNMYYAFNRIKNSINRVLVVMDD